MGRLGECGSQTVSGNPPATAVLSVSKLHISSDPLISPLELYSSEILASECLVTPELLEMGGNAN